MQRFLPNEYVKNIYEINPETLKKKGIKGIITDLDNTLIPWDHPYATEELQAWFETMEKHGLKIIVVSNNNEERVSEFATPLKVPFIHLARKPLAKGYKKALAELGLKKEEAVMVGDQLLTDVFGGNRIGLHTILVVPIVKTDGLWTRFNRMVERRLLKKMKKQGLIQWEGNE